MIYKQGDIKDLYKGSVKAKELYKGNQLLYSADKSLVIYDNGIQYYPFSEIEKAEEGRGSSWSFTNTSTHLSLKGKTGNSVTAHAAGASGTPLIDLTGYNTIWVDWEGSGIVSSQTNMAMYLNKTPSYFNPTYVLISQRTSFTRKISSIDISNVNQQFQITFYSESDGRSINVEVKIYKIWLE